MKVSLQTLVCSCILSIGLTQVAVAQQNQEANEKRIALGFQGGNATVPFFQRTKQFGVVPENEGNQVYIEGAWYRKPDSAFVTQQKKWTWGYGIEGRLVQGNKSYAFLSVAEVHLQWKKWEVYAGRRKETIGLIDTTQTIGAYSWSGNALPMPKIQISTADWVNFAHGWLGFKVGIAHGWFGNKEEEVVGHWLHQKWLYGRLGPASRKWEITGGLNHQVQWGGETKNDDPFFALDGNLAPHPWYSYRFVVIPFLQKLVELDPSKLPPYDLGLAIGNQLGSVDVGFAYQLSPTKRINLYKQQPYDFARSLYTLNNIGDGLYSLSYSHAAERFLNRLNLEFFYSKSQGATRFGKPTEGNFGEIDNYFSHGQYGSWSYRNTLLGTPFIAFLTNEAGEIYLNNRTVAYKASAGGQIGTFAWEGKYAWIAYWGRWGYERRVNQQAVQIQIRSPWYKKGIQLTSSLGYDTGTNLAENTWGFAFALQKRWE
ncbi:MAG: hypothetical protein ACK4R6_10310 [Spirosomataceae bacterium]